MAAAAATLFSSCMNNSDNGYGELEPVIPGLQIYDYASVQNRIAMQPIDMALRLAILEAEADKQEAATGTRPALEQVRVGATQVYERFFGQNNGTKIESVPEGYRITFAPTTIKDYYMCKGTMTVKTDGKPLNASPVPWTAELDPGFQVLLATSGAQSYQAVDMTAGEFSIGRLNGLYQITMRNVEVAQSGKSIRSAWDGSFTLTPPLGGENLAWSDLSEKTFTFDGSARGASLFSLDNATSLEFAYEAEKGVFGSPYQIQGGKETCRLLNGALLTETFPSPLVTITWTLLGNYRLHQTIVYNGHTVTR